MKDKKWWAEYRQKNMEKLKAYRVAWKNKKSGVSDMITVDRKQWEEVNEELARLRAGARVNINDLPDGIGKNTSSTQLDVTLSKEDKLAQLRALMSKAVEPAPEPPEQESRIKCYNCRSTLTKEYEIQDWERGDMKVWLCQDHAKQFRLVK